MTKVKICGLTNVDDVRFCVRAGADFLGFVLSDSPRRVDYRQLERLTEAAGDASSRVGVFANEQDLSAFSRESEVELDFYQVYFDYIPELVRAPRAGWIRAFWMNGESQHDLSHLAAPTLLDFKHSTLEQMTIQLNSHQDAVGNAVILAGKLSPENVGGIVRALKPWGVDVARGTELAPGKKDQALVAQFMKSVRYAG
jgi:phosphoribosylanthranilate isomerase